MKGQHNTVYAEVFSEKTLQRTCDSPVDELSSHAAFKEAAAAIAGVYAVVFATA